VGKESNGGVVAVTDFNEMKDAVVRGDKEACVDLAKNALESGVEPLKAIQEGFAPGMQVVGKGFEDGSLFLPDMMLAAEAMKAGIAVLEKAMPADEAAQNRAGKVVVATVQGDVHDIGKNILRILLSTSGFDVVDLGRDVKVATIIDEAEDEEADIIGVSALMTTTMMYMKELIEELSEAGLRKKFKVMVGGAPVTDAWAREIGADGYAKDAFAAIAVAKDLVS
jgi:corrinoid protein of di/trimethylamine methyltransferase